jgi:hypothetical protein
MNNDSTIELTQPCLEETAFMCGVSVHYEHKLLLVIEPLYELLYFFQEMQESLLIRGFFNCPNQLRRTASQRLMCANSSNPG